LLIKTKEEILLSDEYRFETFFTKFPGGGVEYGEGILDALKREFKEELNVEITSSEFLFFNDFFQESSFHKNIQVTCFYYLVKCTDMNNLGKENYEIPLHENGEKQRWVDWSSLHPENLHFTTDKKALQVLQKRLLSS
jgi:ADP-ribose pyrophosphatase YjhB (NUDIX family)